MEMKILLIIVWAGFCSGTELKFPVNGNGTCILIEVEMLNSLSLTTVNGTKTSVPDWSFDGSSTISGNCNGNIRTISRQFAADSAVFTFSFVDDAQEVSVTPSLNFIPDNIFKNSDKDSIVLETEAIDLSSDTESFECDSQIMKMASKSSAAGNKYDLTVRLNKFQAQAFNLQAGKFSNAANCKAGVTTEEPPTAPPQPTTKPDEPTTKPDEPTTKPDEPTTKPDEPTTKPDTPTTEPTTAPPAPTPTTPVPTNSHPAQTVSLMDSGVTCVVMKGQFLFTIPYQMENGTMGKASVGLQDINPNMTTGSCAGAEMNEVDINFLENWWLNVTFMSDAKSGMLQADDTKYWWHMVNLTYVMDEKVFPAFNKTGGPMRMHSMAFEGNQFEATVEGSYLCDSDTTTDLGDSFQMETWDLQYNAFQTKNVTTFSDDNVQECSADAKTNSIVPIAVGAALAGLVVIVLIAYLIGRRRNRKGYESV